MFGIPKVEFCNHVVTLLVQIFFVSTSALQPNAIQFIHANETVNNPLCDVGCTCLTNGYPILDCSRRYIPILPTSIHLEDSITSLKFSGNYISYLRVNTFSRADGITELDFSQNYIKKIDDLTFAPFKSLSSLVLSHNRLSEVTPGLLDGLNNLVILQLGHNVIERLSSEAFMATPHLQELRLQYNPIFYLSEEQFLYLPNLKRLDLQDLGLVSLPHNVFLPTPNLQWLSLSHNAFETVPEEALSQARGLQNLDLSGNDFTVLDRGDFRRLSTLSHLYLNNLLRLKRIEKDALAGLDSLESLSCSYNPNLFYIDEEAFGSENSTISRQQTSPHEQLYLRQNALRTLKSPLKLDTWQSLSFVDLADNPWKCDCQLVWMQQLKKETQMNILCDSPLHLRGRAFGTVAMEELDCQEKWVFTTFMVTISLMVAFGLLILALSSIVCSRSRIGLYIRSKGQFSYDKVISKPEIVDLEWDPSADV